MGVKIRQCSFNKEHTEPYQNRDPKNMIHKEHTEPYQNRDPKNMIQLNQEEFEPLHPNSLG